MPEAPTELWMVLVFFYFKTILYLYLFNQLIFFFIIRFWEFIYFNFVLLNFFHYLQLKIFVTTGLKSWWEILMEQVVYFFLSPMSYTHGTWKLGTIRLWYNMYTTSPSLFNHCSRRSFENLGYTSFLRQQHNF